MKVKKVAKFLKSSAKVPAKVPLRGQRCQPVMIDLDEDRLIEVLEDSVDELRREMLELSRLIENLKVKMEACYGRQI